MKPFPEFVMQLREEVRVLRIDNDRLTRAHQAQKSKAEQLEKQLGDQAKRLKEQLEQSTKTKMRYQVALFDHGNSRHRSEPTKKKKGGQPGHQTTNREAHPTLQPFEHERIFAPVCGHCGEALPRVQATRHKELVNIVLHPQVVKLLIESERQWCRHCKQEVSARDPRSLPFTEYGLNLFLLGACVTLCP